MHGIFGTQPIPEPFESMPKEKLADAEKEIQKKCFSRVIPQFQSTPGGNRASLGKMFYEHDKHFIHINPTALKFLKENHSLLSKAITLEWARFLEKINPGLPMLISKIESIGRHKGSLEKVKLVLLKHFDTCFYCNKPLSSERQLVHVDHFIPWSYVFEDELWNMVLVCRGCNLKKHGSLPSERFVYRLVERNKEYLDTIDLLKKSLSRLNPESNCERAITKLFQNCLDYGFAVRRV
jgi:hypothetical protein